MDFDNNIATEAELEAIETSTQQEAKKAKENAWEASLEPIRNEAKQLTNCLSDTGDEGLVKEGQRLLKDKSINRKKIASFARKSLRILRKQPNSQTEKLQSWIANYFEETQPKFSAALQRNQNIFFAVKKVEVSYEDDAT